MIKYDVTAAVPVRLRALADILKCPMPFDPFSEDPNEDRCVSCELRSIAEQLDPDGARALRDKRIQEAIAS